MFLRSLHIALGALALFGVTASQTSSAEWISNSATDAFDLIAATQQTLELPEETGQSFSVELELRGERRILRLDPHSIRTPDYQLIVQTDEGLEVRASTPKTYRGAVEGLPGTRVAASLIDGQLLGMVRFEDGEIWGIQPVTEVEPDAPRDLHVVYDQRDVTPMDIACGAAPLAGADFRSTPSSAQGGIAGSGNLVIAEIACDSDFQYFQKLGNTVAGVENRIEAIINGVDAIYDGEVGIYYTITTTIVRTTAADPYNSTDIGTLLNQFQAHWNSTMGGQVRDVAHMFTGQTPPFGVIGVAYLNVVCNLSSAYGVVERFTTSLTSEIGLSAHELGHNWAATHCNSTSGCAIMCSGLGGCTGSITQFGPAATSQIVGKKNSVGCLEDFNSPFAPQVFFAVPNQISAYSGDEVVLSGLFFNGTQTVTVGGSTLLPGSGFTLDDPTQLTLKLPPSTTLGPVDVQLNAQAGPSNVITIEYIEQNPPLLLGSSFSLPILPYTWNLVGRAGDLYVLEYSFDPTTVTVAGVDFMANPKKILFTGTLDATGLGSESTLPGPLNGATAFFQLLTFDPLTGFSVGASSLLEVFLN